MKHKPVTIVLKKKKNFLTKTDCSQKPFSLETRRVWALRPTLSQKINSRSHISKGRKKAEFVVTCQR